MTANPEIIRFRYPLVLFPLKDSPVNALCLYRVKDGDTVEVKLDRGWDDERITGLRIFGVDAPEKSTRQNLLEREAGGLVKLVTQRWLDLQRATGDQFFASSEVRSKYARRTIGRLWCGSIDRELSAFLLEGGFVRRYLGGHRDDWPAQDLDEIIEKAKAYLSDDRTPVLGTPAPDLGTPARSAETDRLDPQGS